jgi:predicted molibdopterin-dependent oxidoreductase YjgC
MRQLIGTNNIDHRDGGDVAALPAGIPALAEVMKPQYGPDPKHDVIFLFGVDPSEEMPVLDLHLKRAVRRGKATLVIAHPRQIELTRYKGPFLQYAPGSEVTLLNGLLRAATELKDDAASEARKIATYAGDKELRSLCGVAPECGQGCCCGAGQRQECADHLRADGRARRAGQAAAQALQNLALYTGHRRTAGLRRARRQQPGLPRPGASCPTACPATPALDDAAARTCLEQLWGGALPTYALARATARCLNAAGAAIKALFIMGADPASERPAWAANLDKVDFLVVQDIFLTETAQQADVVLPAVSWAEQDGTFTNLEGRVQRASRRWATRRARLRRTG